MLAGLFCLNLQAQEPCQTMPLLHKHIQENPMVKQAMERAENENYEWRKSGAHHPDRVVYTIPTVVHVLYTNATENISNAQIMSQLEILNQDYRRMNPDTGNTRSIFSGLAADVGIEFCLATTDPDGNPTTGITRTPGNPGLLGFYDPFTDNAKSNSLGGKDPWPSDKYLNIWVCPLFPVVLGYAQFPWDDPVTDGVVIGYTAFGTMGTVTAPYDGGRTTVHEVGHWLGLRHIWGDGDCTATDSVIDTPNADAASNGDCDTSKNTCVDTLLNDAPDMVENYMDYSQDNCMNMFTQGQKDRMLFYLNTWRASLLTSEGCSLLPTSHYETLAEKILLYPNPALENVHISIPRELGAPHQIRVFDVQGKEVNMALKGQNELVLERGDHPAGIYFVQIHTARGSITRKVLFSGK